LNRCELLGAESDFLVVDFRILFGIKLKSIQELTVGKPSRFGLLPPYREHLAQAFARYFMRVGLPTDIPGF